MLAMDEEIKCGDLFPTKTAKVIEETLLRRMKQKQIWSNTGGNELVKMVTVHCYFVNYKGEKCRHQIKVPNL